MFDRSKPEGSPEASGKKRLILIVVGAVAGIFLLILGSGNLLPSSEEKNDQPKEPSAQEELVQYQTYLENRVKTLCESVNGVSGVTAIVTLSGNFEEIYAKEFVDGNEEYVIVGSGSNASALHISRLAPEIAGIGVVCRGGGNADVRQELTSLLCATFHIPSNRVYIVESKN